MAEPQRKLRPLLKQANPGRGVEARVASTGGGAPETVNVLDLMERVLTARGHSVRRQETWLELADSGFTLLPQIAGVEAMERGGFHTVTTVQVHHPALTRDGVFEYQHSWGDAIAEAMAKGFEQWYEVDFVTFQEALLPTPQKCMTMVMSFPAKGGRPAYVRRAVLGPVAHFRANTDPSAPAEEHPFCPCCFVTNTFMAYKELIEDAGFFALRFFAARGADGAPQADCRVNGEDWPAGMDALRDYVQKWPGTGYEFRKQSVLLQTVDGSAVAGGQTS